MNFFNNNKNEGIYLDYAATTPVSERARKAMEAYFSNNFANPSSLHIPGQKAEASLDELREEAANILGASWKEIIFVPSATYSINLAIRGAVKAKKKILKEAPHIVTTNIEHSAVLNTCRDLEKEGVDVTYVPVSKEGFVSVLDIQNAMKKNTVLVSVMYVNNEIGTVQPIKEIAEVLKDFPAYLHVDAVQAANYLGINATDLGVDMMTLSSHKIYGPKGAALLYKKENVEISPIVTGGDQERKLSSGTENMPCIAGFVEALKEIEELKPREPEQILALRKIFIDRVLNNGKNIGLNGSNEQRVPNNINIYFKNISSEALIPLFDAEKVYVSGGSACTSRTPEPSHVIKAIGREEYAKNSIRVSLGRETSKEDIERAADVFIKISKEHN